LAFFGWNSHAEPLYYKTGIPAIVEGDYTKIKTTGFLFCSGGSVE
jgi:hypothetical protein